MAVRDFEFFHGIALARLVQNKGSASLQILETIPGEAWSSFTLNDAITFVIRHRARPRQLKRKGGGRSWTFAFTYDQLRRMSRLARDRPVHLALVCGGQKGREGRPEVCLLHPDEVTRLLDLASFLPQRLTVKSQPRKELWVSRGSRDLKVPRTRFDDWKIPGR